MFTERNVSNLLHPFTLCPPEFVTCWEHATLRRWLPMPAKLMLTYALVEQIVELKRGIATLDWTFFTGTILHS